MNGSSSNNNMQKFKGVVPQQNGHWGAQIYANHQRIWLGTFKSEREAAMAYDSATIKLRSGESHRNFPWNDQTVQEPHFQSHYTTEAILSMIRDGTYPSKFASFLISTQTQTLTLTLTLNNEDHHQEAGITRMQNNNNNNGDEEKFSCTLLFQKELTPSDVGKLNRLVIPKKHASRYFPYVSGSAEEGGDIDDHNNYISTENNNNNSDTELVFYDKLMRSWKFRYCYWRSSQSFVFTRGWNKFVKDKNLKAKDVIAFYKCEPLVNNHNGLIKDHHQVFSLIDVIYNNVNDEIERRQCFGEIKNSKRDLIKQTNTSAAKMLSFNINEEAEDDDDEGINIIEGDDDDDHHDQIALQHSSTHHIDEQKGFRLFGVTIK